MEILETPDQMLRHAMKEYGIGRETAIMLVTKSFEATLRVEGDLTDEKVNRKIAEMLVGEGKRRTPWFVSFMEAHYRRHLPKWTRINDEALERGQDAATRMSVSENVVMDIAEERIKLVQLAKQGKSIEEITETAFSFDDGRSVEELYSLLLRQTA
jgi:hypothetical protein